MTHTAADSKTSQKHIAIHFTFTYFGKIWYNIKFPAAVMGYVTFLHPSSQNA